MAEPAVEVGYIIFPIRSNNESDLKHTFFLIAEQEHPKLFRE